MFTVTGLTPDGLAYAVRVDPDATGDFGTVAEAAPKWVAHLLEAHVGEDIRANIFETVRLDLADPRSVLAALYQFTDVRGVEGDDIPVLFDTTGVPDDATV